MDHIENIIIGNPIIDAWTLLSDDIEDWESNESHKTVWEDERFLPRILVKYGFIKSTSEVKRNRPELFISLNKLDFIDIKVGKKKLWIIVGE